MGFSEIGRRGGWRRSRLGSGWSRKKSRRNSREGDGKIGARPKEGEGLMSNRGWD